MPSPILEAAEIARNRFVKGEIEAGLVFAANAFEYQRTNPGRAATFRADARDCYVTATGIIRQAGPMQSWPLELATMLDELQRRLDLLRATNALPAAA